MATRKDATGSKRTRKLTILAQDPSVEVNGRPLLVDVDVPMEVTMPGPQGYRVHVIDYDASTGILYSPAKLYSASVTNWTKDAILGDPAFHAQNVYAVVMRTLAQFESALGRRVSWSFYGHQIKVAPHAFAEANAFYSEADHALLFGYVRGPKGTIFTCLSHDVVAHETAHALIDGLRDRYTDPSSPDQAGFHEGFADVVALLSVFSLPEVVKYLIESSSRHSKSGRVTRKDIELESLRDSVLLIVVWFSWAGAE